MSMSRYSIWSQPSQKPGNIDGFCGFENRLLTSNTATSALNDLPVTLSVPPAVSFARRRPHHADAVPPSGVQFTESALTLGVPPGSRCHALMMPKLRPGATLGEYLVSLHQSRAPFG